MIVTNAQSSVALTTYINETYRGALKSQVCVALQRPLTLCGQDFFV